MFVLSHHPYTPPYQLYSPYQHLLLEQELQWRKRLDAYRRGHLEAEELNRWRQHVVSQAELERRRQVAIEAERDRRRSTMGSRMEGLLNMLYAARPMPSPPSNLGSSGSTCEGDLERAVVVEGVRVDGPIEEVGRAGRYSELVNKMTLIAQGSPRSQDPKLVPESAGHSDTTPIAPAANPQVDNTETKQTHLLDTSVSHAAVAGILSSFDSMKCEFTFPVQLDFLPSSLSSDSPKLSYASINAPLHQYEHVLTRLLTGLDAVDSHGDEEEREARKEAVKVIEKELARLDKWKVEEWVKKNKSGMGLKAGEVEEPRIEGDLEEKISGGVPEGIMEEIHASVAPLPNECKLCETGEVLKSPEQGELIPSSLDHPTTRVPREAEHQLEAMCRVCLQPLGDVQLPVGQCSSYNSTTAPNQIPAQQLSLGEASSSDESESETDEYVDLDCFTSGSETESEAEEADVEGATELAGMEEWELDF